MAQNNSEQFNAYTYIDELVEEMGLQNEDPVKLGGLKNAMFEALTRQLLQAASENIEPEVVDMVMDELRDEPDPAVIVQALLQSSPTAQIAMLEALETFRENTFEAFKVLKI